MAAFLTTCDQVIERMPMEANQSDGSTDRIHALEQNLRQFYSMNKYNLDIIQKQHVELQRMYEREAELENKLRFYINPALVLVPVNRAASIFWAAFHTIRRAVFKRKAGVE